MGFTEVVEFKGEEETTEESNKPANVEFLMWMGWSLTIMLDALGYNEFKC